MILIPLQSWAEFKALVIGSKNLPIQYAETDNDYELYAAEASIFVWACHLIKDGGSDVTDWETNYKPNGNRPLEQRAADGRVIVRAESRPQAATSYFTMRGDSATGIGNGATMHWDFSNSDDVVTEGVPEGYKRKRICLTFVDSIWIKEGTLYFDGAPHGCYIDMYVACPAGGYYLDRDGNVCAATEDTPLSHYVNHHRVFGTCQMGDELNTEAANENAIPAGYKVCIEITTPTSDTTSKGNGELEIYRVRTCLLPDEEV